MNPWDDDVDREEEELEDLSGGCGFEELISSVLSFFVFVSVFFWISEKLKELFRCPD